MRLLLDQGLPRSAAEFLREAGIDTVHVGEIGYVAADDATILQIQTVLGRCSEDLKRGAMVTVQLNRIRIRRLPVLP